MLPKCWAPAPGKCRQQEPQATHSLGAANPGWAGALGAAHRGRRPRAALSWWRQPWASGEGAGPRPDHDPPARPARGPMPISETRTLRLRIPSSPPAQGRRGHKAARRPGARRRCREDRAQGRVGVGGGPPSCLPAQEGPLPAPRLTPHTLGAPAGCLLGLTAQKRQHLERLPGCWRGAGQPEGHSGSGSTSCGLCWVRSALAR